MFNYVWVLWARSYRERRLRVLRTSRLTCRVCLLYAPPPCRQVREFLKFFAGKRDVTVAELESLFEDTRDTRYALRCVVIIWTRCGGHSSRPPPPPLPHSAQQRPSALFEGLRVVLRAAVF